MGFARTLAVAGLLAAGGTAAATAVPSAAIAAPVVAVVVQGSSVTISTSDCAENGAVAAILSGSEELGEKDMAGNPEASGVLSATFDQIPPGTYTATVDCKNTSSPDTGTRQFTVGPDGNPDTGDGAMSASGTRSTVLAATGLAVLGAAVAGGVVLVVRAKPGRR